jgi:hypothetical protein
VTKIGTHLADANELDHDLCWNFPRARAVLKSAESIWTNPHKRNSMLFLVGRAIDKLARDFNSKTKTFVEHANELLRLKHDTKKPNA